MAAAQISNAYEVLSDDQKRSIYDRYGEAGLKGGMGGMGGADMGGFNNPFDLFEQFFGAGGGRAGGAGGFGGFGGGFGGGARSRAMQGEDEKYELKLDFLDAVFGARCVLIHKHPMSPSLVRLVSGVKGLWPPLLEQGCFALLSLDIMLGFILVALRCCKSSRGG